MLLRFGLNNKILTFPLQDDVHAVTHHTLFAVKIF